MQQRQRHKERVEEGQLDNALRKGLSEVSGKDSLCSYLEVVFKAHNLLTAMTKKDEKPKLVKKAARGQDRKRYTVPRGPYLGRCMGR